MTILGIDGALGAFSVAVARDGQLLGTRSETGNVALESGLGLIAGLMRETGVEPAHLTRLAVGIGPGGFTGLRIAVAYAKSLAQAWERPLVPVSSFDILECGRTLPTVLSVVVGRPGVISARFRDGSSERRASGRIAGVLDELGLRAGSETLDVVAAPKDVLGALAERGIIVNPLAPLLEPAAAAAVQVASRREPARSPHEVRADYGELPAATVRKP